MNTFDTQGNYVDENGTNFKQAFHSEYKRHDLSKVSEAKRQKVSNILKNFDISKISGGRKNASETDQ